MASMKSIASPPQHKILLYLRAQVDGQRFSEVPFVALPDGIRSPKAIHALVLKDFITLSRLCGAPQYKITGRGLKALAQIEQIQARRTLPKGICKTEGCDNPSYVSPAGTRRGHCKRCLAEIERVRYHEIGHTYDPTKPCPRCGGKRHVGSTGIVKPYCHACLLENNRACVQTHRRKVAQQLAQGVGITCRTAGCSNPVTTTSGGIVKRWCRECMKARYRKERRSQILKRQQDKLKAFFKKH